jgi:hypothetical protein
MRVTHRTAHCLEVHHVYRGDLELRLHTKNPTRHEYDRYNDRGAGLDYEMAAGAGYEPATEAGMKHSPPHGVVTYIYLPG